MADARTARGRRAERGGAHASGPGPLNNEDLPVLDAARGVFGVIDGIGGQAGGEVAAATARDVILQRLARPVGTAAERVREAIAIANNEIYRRAAGSAELAGMGCVITLAIVADGRLTIGHVGDTRLYKIRPESIRKLTRDHSPVGELEDSGELPEPEAMRASAPARSVPRHRHRLSRQGRAGVRGRHRRADRARRGDPALLGRPERHAPRRHHRAHRPAARRDRRSASSKRWSRPRTTPAGATTSPSCTPRCRSLPSAWAVLPRRR